MEPVSKRRFFVIGLVIFCLSNTFSDNKQTTPQISPSILTAGINFEIAFDIERLNFSEPVLTYLRDPQGFQVIDTPIISYNQTTPEMPGLVHIVLKCKTLVNGYYTIPVISFAFPEGDTVESVTALLPIGLKSNPSFVPPDLEWSVPKEVFYEGQNIHVEIKVVYTKNLLIPQKIALPSVPGLSFTSSSSLSPSTDITLAGVSFRSIPILGFNIIASRGGVYRLPEIKLEFAEFSKITPPKIIEIRSLPSSEISAVGNFHFSLIQDKTKWLPKQNIVLRFISSGEGNFQGIKIPAFLQSDLELKSKETNLSLHETPNGYEGYREDVFTFNPKPLGNYTVNLAGFNIFNPKTGLIQVINPLSSTIQIEAFSQSIDARSPVIQSTTIDILWLSIIIILFSIGIYIYSLSRVVLRIKKWLILLSILILIGGVILVVINYPFTLINNDFSNISKLYDENNKLLALKGLFNALSIDPANSDLLNFAQYAKFPNINLGLSPILLISIISLVIIGLSVLNFIKSANKRTNLFIIRSHLTVLLIVVILLIVNQSNINGYSHIAQRKGIHVLPITNEVTKPIAELEEGELIRIIDDYEKFYLIESQNKIKGWVLKTDLPVKL